MNDVKADAKAIFLEALDCKGADELMRFLERACASDTALRTRVEELMRAHQDAGAFLGGPEKQGATCDQPSAERPGSMVGPYKLLQQIGEGGMGTVFMAEQTQPVQRKVALKVIKPGMDSCQVIARFEAERQALAMMDHVNIARVLDAGTTEAGRPYFVMELVHGVPITKYCDDNHLTPRQRLELFVPVCQAIQHAHQKGIIHRDVKPSNVMITLYDGKPVPKVIDFGVAKATEQKLTERTLFTQYGTMVGTLEYMSPEQAEMSALGVDTRSDIYSLGVLLYELLTGSTPLTHKRMKEAAYAEILRMIKEEEPPRPSTRLSDSGEALASISAQRHMEPAKLTKLVRGELDWIVMKTLEKDRSRRYETANDFAADVQRYLNDEPVQACPPSAWYRFRKFARRNKRALATAAFLGGTLLAAVVLAVVVLAVSNVAITRERDEKAAALKQRGEALGQKAAALVRADEARVKAQHHAHRAEANFQAALGVVDQIASLWQLKGLTKEEVRISEALDEKARQIFLGFVAKNTGNPETRLELAWAYVRLARTEVRLGNPAKAITAERQAIALFEQLAADAPDVPNHRLELVRCYSTLAARLERTPDFLRVLSASLVGFLGSPPQQAPLLAASALIHGGTQRGGPELPEAKQARSQALALCERLLADFPNDPQYAGRLAEEYFRLGRIARPGPQRVAAFRSVRARCSKLATCFPADPQCQRWLAQSCPQLAGVLPAGAPEAAELLKQERVIRQKLVKDFHQPGDISWLGMDNLRRGRLRVKQGRPREAEELFRQTVALNEQLPDRQKNLVLDWAYRDLGRLLEDVGQPGEAEKIYRKGAKLFVPRPDAIRDWPLSYPEASLYYLRLGDMLRKTGRLQEAEQAYRDGLAIEAKLAALDEQIGLGMKWGPPESWPWHRMGLADRYVLLGQFFKDTGQPQKAEEAYRQAVDVRQKLAADCPIYPEVRDHLARTCAELSKFLKDTGQPQKAGQAYGRAWEVYREAVDLHQLLDKNWLTGRFDLVLAGYHLGEGLEATGQLQEAEQAYRRVAGLWQQLADKDHEPGYRHNCAQTLTRLGMLLSRQGKHTEAEAALRKALPLREKLAADFATVPEYRQYLFGNHYNLANILAVLGQWDKAAAETGKAIELRPSDDNCWMMHASFLLRAGDAKEYRQACKQMLERYRETKDPIIAHRIALSCLLIPDAVSDQKLPVELAKRAVAGAPHNGWCEITQGLALYRAGQFEQAVKQLRQVLKKWPDDPYTLPGADGAPLITWLSLAMAYQRLGQSAEARRWLNKAVQRMDQELAEKGIGPLRKQCHVWAMCQILRDQAETLVKKADANQAKPKAK